jgi:hypothetical protein
MVRTTRARTCVNLRVVYLLQGNRTIGVVRTFYVTVWPNHSKKDCGIIYVSSL